MNISLQKSFRLTLFGIAILSFIEAQPAGATVIFQAGNQQYDNVNIAAAVDVSTIIGNTVHNNWQVTFENMIGPDGSTQVTMHGQHGVAFVQSYLDSLPGATDTGFSSLTLMAQAGYGFTAGDFALDELNTGLPTGSVTFNGVDQFGNSNTGTFSMGGKGQNLYNFFTQNGELVTSLVISAPTTSLLEDIKQVSVNEARIPVPEPGSLVLLGVGLVGLGFLHHRKLS